MNIEVERKLDTELRRNLSNKELEAAKERLINIASPQEVDAHIEVIQGIDAYGATQLRAQLKDIHRKQFGEDLIASPSKPKRKLLLIALAIMAFISIILATNFLGKKTPDKIYAEYYEPYTYQSGQRNVDENSLFKLGILYQEKNYTAFISEYEKHFKSDADQQSDLILASGIAYLEIDQPYKAIFQFKKIIENEDFNYMESAQWYEALALFKAQEYQSCKEKLERLAGEDGSQYYARSRSMLKEIEGFM